MNIKATLPILLLAVCALLVAGLTSCREQPNERHAHTIFIVPAVDPTCDTPGSTESQRCTGCGQMIVQPVHLPSRGHTYDTEWTIDRAPTATLDGEMSRHCTVCDTRSAITAIPRLIAPTEGLVYELNEKGTGYVCLGFAAGKNLQELSIPSTHLGLPVVEIGAQAFANQTALTSLTIPESVQRISKEAFGGCNRLAAITLPDTVKYLADGAFKGTALYMDGSMWLDGVLYIGNHLIEARSSVAKGDYVIREGTVTVGGTAFMNCSGLTSITVPEGVVSIGNSAFYGCSALRQIHLPDSLEIIGNGAFAYCISLVEFRLPMGVHSILSNPFPGSTALQRIEVDPRNKVFHSKDNCLIETATGTLTIGCVTSQIPADGSVTRIGTAAFYECGALVTLDIPEGITEIGISAFHQCVNLLEISLPDSLEVIGRQAFRGCVGLTEVTVPENVKRIDEGAFCYCEQLLRITLPGGLTDIDANAFAYCKNLRSLNLPDSLRTLGTSSLAGCTQLEFETFGNCLYLSNWLIGAVNTDVESVSLKPTTVGIGPSAFSGCHALTSITLPESVRYIGSAAFLSCWQLTELRIPAAVTTIGTRTFAYCTWLRDLYLPASITDIGSEALLDCTSLTALHFSGTPQAWAAVKKAKGWNEGADSLTVFYN